MKKISENDHHFNYISIIIPLIALSIVALGAIPLMIEVSKVTNDYLDLDNSPCHDITVNDTFSKISGGGFGRTYTNYYIVSDNIVYEMTINENTTEIYRWITIIKGQPYNVKTYKAMVQFCDHPRLMSHMEN